MPTRVRTQMVSFDICNCFWTNKQIDSLLENASPTDPVLLEELLSQEDILQECKNQNKKLVEL